MPTERSHRILRGMIALLMARIFGDSLEAVVLPWSALTMLESLMGAAGVFVVQNLSWVFMPTLAGYLIDKVTRKTRIVVASVFGQSALLVVLALFPIDYLHDNIVLILSFFLIIFIIGIFDNLIDYYVTVTIPAIIGKDPQKLQEVNSKISIWSRLSRITGFLLAGPLAILFGLKALLIDALLLITSLALFQAYMYELTISETGAIKPENRQTYRLLIRLPKFAKMLLISVIPFNFAVGSWRIIMINYMNIWFQALGKAMYAFTNAVLVVSGIAGSLLILRYRMRVKPERFVCIGLLGQVVFVALLYVLSLIPADLLVAFIVVSAIVSILGFMNPLINVSLNSIFQSRIDTRALGRVKGIFDSVATTAIMVSGVITAYLLECSILNSYIPLVYSLIGLCGALLGIRAVTLREENPRK